MSDEETRRRRAEKFQKRANPVAKEIRKDQFRMRRVEDKTKRFERRSRQQLLKEYYTDDTETND